MLAILYAILPVFIIILIGIIVERIKLIPSNAGMVLNVYAIRLALPVLLVNIMANAPPAGIFQWKLWLAIVASHLTVYAGCYYADLKLIKRGKAPAIVSGMAASSSQTAFIGLPIIMNLLPGNHEALVVAGILALAPTISLAIGQIQLEIVKQSNEAGFKKVILKAVFLNPLVLGMLAGSFICLFNAGLWAPIDRASALIGSTAAPCALIAVGMGMEKYFKLAVKAAYNYKMIYQSCMAMAKLLVLPLLTAAFLYVLGVSGIPFVVPIIMLATGVAAASYVVAEIYQVIPEQCAMALVLTNVLSIVTLTLFAYILIEVLRII